MTNQILTFLLAKKGGGREETLGICYSVSFSIQASHRSNGEPDSAPCAVSATVQAGGWGGEAGSEAAQWLSWFPAEAITFLER